MSIVFSFLSILSCMLIIIFEHVIKFEKCQLTSSKILNSVVKVLREMLQTFGYILEAQGKQGVILQIWLPQSELTFVGIQGPASNHRNFNVSHSLMQIDVRAKVPLHRGVRSTCRGVSCHLLFGGGLLWLQSLWRERTKIDINGMFKWLCRALPD